jgi:hypothetical protein
MRRICLIAALLALAGVEALGAQAATREVAPRLLGRLANVPTADDAVPPTFRSAADSLEWESARERAFRAPENRLVISLFERRLLWMDGVDTLFIARIAVGSGDSLRYGSQEWEFLTPRGRRAVIAKERNPVWVPPLWHYVRHAEKTGRRLVELRPRSSYRLPDGSRIVIRGRQVGRLFADQRFVPYEQGDHIFYEDLLFVPPIGTINRRIVGELGAYKLDLGEAYLIHGTPHKSSIGTAATAGCIRVGDADLEFLYSQIRVGTPVYIY